MSLSIKTADSLVNTFQGFCPVSNGKGKLTDISSYFVSSLPQYKVSSTPINMYHFKYRKESFRPMSVDIELHKENMVTVGDLTWKSITVGKATKITFSTEYKDLPLGMLGLNLLSSDAVVDPLPNSNFLLNIRLPKSMFSFKLNPDNDGGMFGIGESIQQERGVEPIAFKSHRANWAIEVKMIQVYVHSKWITITQNKLVSVDSGSDAVFFTKTDYQRLRQEFSIPEHYWESSHFCTELENVFGPLKLMLVSSKDDEVIIDYLIRTNKR